MSESLERLARNQALFREVNERIETIAGDNDAVEFVCECSNTDCSSTIKLSRSEYERVRSKSSWFVIKLDHDCPDRAGRLPGRWICGRREAHRGGVPGADGSPCRWFRRVCVLKCVRSGATRRADAPVSAFSGAESPPSRRAGVHLKEGKEPASPESGSLPFRRAFPRTIRPSGAAWLSGARTSGTARS
jgi:hypothetical protein